MAGKSCTLNIANSMPSFGRKRRTATRFGRYDSTKITTRSPAERLPSRVEPDRGHAGADNDRVVAILQLGREQLELAGRRIRVARVVEAVLLRLGRQRLGDRRIRELHGPIDGRHDGVVAVEQLDASRMRDSGLLLHGGTARTLEPVQRLAQIGDEVLDVLEPDRQAHEAVRDADAQALGRRSRRRASS